MTSRGDAFRTPTSRQHHSTAGAAVRVRVAPAAAGTPGRRRRRTDARPGALTAGGETAMVRTAERLQSARLGSRLSTEAPDRGPDPRHRRRRACPDPPGLYRDTTVHARRTTQHHAVVLRHLQQDARGTRPQSRRSARTSGRARPIARDGPGSDICELHTHLTCDMRVKMTYACHKPTIFMCAAWHRMRTSQLAMALAASHRALPPHEAHRAVPTAKCVSRPAQDRTHDHAVGALLLHACHECPRSHRALRALNRQTRRRPRRYPRRHVRRLSQLPDRHPGPVSIPATRPPPRNIRPVRQRPPAVRPHHCAARITRITRHPLSRQRHPPRS